MKWSVIALVALGTVAALCATVLVGALRSSDRADAAEPGTVAPETTIVVAARDLPPGLLIENDALVVEQILISGAPENFIADPVLAVGKVINAGMVKGQAILKTSFAEGSGLLLASSLPPGMRAVGVQLGGSSSLRGLLYAGCNVDVLATFKAERGKLPITRTLLERVRVLGIEDQTIVSSESKGTSNRTYRRDEMVVLMLDAKQAKDLKSASASGTISLAMRHPLDDAAEVIEEQPEEKPVVQPQPGPQAEEHVTEEINGGVRETVTYTKRGDTWQRKEG
jgi:Flp pilus assembly protein CpaB